LWAFLRQARGFYCGDVIFRLPGGIVFYTFLLYTRKQENANFRIATERNGKMDTMFKSACYGFFLVLTVTALTGCPLLNEPVNGGTVPDVAGMPRVEAAVALADAGYTVGVVTEEESATITAGSVISQDPAAGTEAEPGTAVDLVVAAAPDDDDDGGGNTLGDVTVDTTLKAGEYRVEEDVQVTNDATLTLEAGVKLVFDQGHVLSVENSGKLESQGTAGNPVVLTGKEKTAGYWGGVRFYNTNSAANRLEYTIIEYGGG
jgi:hypothetical protein